MPVDKEMLGKLEVHETFTGPEADFNTVVVHFQVQLHEQGGFMRPKLQLLLTSVENDAGNEALCTRWAKSCFRIAKLRS